MSGSWSVALSKKQGNSNSVLSQHEIIRHRLKLPESRFINEYFHSWDIITTLIDV